VAGRGGKSKEEITSFLIELVAQMTGLPRSRINVSESFENYSIDSQGTVAAASKLSEFLGSHISAIQIYTTGCIAELADFCEDVVTKMDLRGDKEGRDGAALPLPITGEQDVQKAVKQVPSVDTYQVQYDDALDDITDAQLADALDPSRNRKIAITFLQVLNASTRCAYRLHL
jgi:hypothetical protein